MPTTSYVTNLETAPEATDLTEAQGWHGLKLQFLVSADTAGSDSIVFGRSVFPPGSEHSVHRHPHAEEFLCVLEGSIAALDDDRKVVLGPGDVIFHGRNVWHSHTNASETEDAVGLWGWAGAGSMEAAGYEVREPESENGGDE